MQADLQEWPQRSTHVRKKSRNCAQNKDVHYPFVQLCVFKCVSSFETPCKIRNNCPKSLWKAHNLQQSIRSSHVVSERDVPECISQVAVAALGWPERAVQGDGGLADAWAVYCAVFISIVAVEGALRMNDMREKTWKSDFSVLLPDFFSKRWH